MGLWGEIDPKSKEKVQFVDKSNVVKLMTSHFSPEVSEESPCLCTSSQNDYEMYAAHCRARAAAVESGCHRLELLASEVRVPDACSA
eukprot:1144552-Pelagomonas_calceolata.AAC.1